MIRKIKDRSFIQRLRDFLKSPYLFPYILLLIVVVSVPVTVILLSSRLDVRQKAETLPATSTDGIWYFNDKDTGFASTPRELFCITSSDCKMIYFDYTTDGLKFVDCDDETCTTNSMDFIDGVPGCPITNCSTSSGSGDFAWNSSLYCLATDDCKVVYQNHLDNKIYFIDCDNATCTTGTRSQIEGSGCTIMNCTSIGGQYPDIYCVATDDCKVTLRTDGVSFIDCDNSTCSTGTESFLDHNSSCVLTGCDSTFIGSNGFAPYHINVQCFGTDDCKLSYEVNYSGVPYYTELKFADCSNANCSAGSVVIIDGQPGCTLTGCTAFVNDPDPRPSTPRMFCLSATDCKIAYIDSQRAIDFTQLPNSLMLADCNDATCSSGTTVLVDGYNGTCTVTNCSNAANGISEPAIYCTASDDCKITYQNLQKILDLRFVDCNNDSCNSGVINKLDGDINCTLGQCRSTNIFDYSPSIFCSSSTDCKIKYYEETNTNVWLADCNNSDCSTGSTRTIDGHFMSKTQGSKANYNNYFGTYIVGEKTRYEMVTANTFPSGSNTYLGSGTYRFRWYFLNQAAVGQPLTWNYTIGYCNISDNCETKVAIANSGPQQLDGSIVPYIDVFATAAAGLIIPGPDNSKRIYIDLQISDTVGFPYIFPYSNSTDADFANTFLEIPFEIGPTPTNTPTPTPTNTPTPTPTLPPGVTPADTSTPTPTNTPTPTPTNTPTPTVVPNTSCSFTGPTTLNVNEIGTFRSTSTGTIVSYVWTASSGTPTTGITSSFDWSASLAGSYKINLTITDALNRQYSCESNVGVVIPTANTPTPVIIVPKGPPKTGIKIHE